jgi:hypothetical protein
MKIISESFDIAQDERRGIDFTNDVPFMLRHSKHSEFFFRNLLARKRSLLRIEGNDGNEVYNQRYPNPSRPW